MSSYINEKLEKAHLKSSKVKKHIEKLQQKLTKTQKELERHKKRKREIEEILQFYSNLDIFGYMDEATKIEIINEFQAQQHKKKKEQ